MSIKIRDDSNFSGFVRLNRRHASIYKYLSTQINMQNLRYIKCDRYAAYIHIPIDTQASKKIHSSVKRKTISEGFYVIRDQSREYNRTFHSKFTRKIVVTIDWSKT